MDGARGKVSATVQEAGQAAQTALSGNQGQGMEAFKAKWEAEDSAHSVAQDGVTGAQVIGAALFACAAIVIALKITVIVQLTIPRRNPGRHRPRRQGRPTRHAQGGGQGHPCQFTSGRSSDRPPRRPRRRTPGASTPGRTSGRW